MLTAQQSFRIRGMRDMLRECAKQFRAMGMPGGHGAMADRHADIADMLLSESPETYDEMLQRHQSEVWEKLAAINR